MVSLLKSLHAANILLKETYNVGELCINESSECKLWFNWVTFTIILLETYIRNMINRKKMYINIVQFPCKYYRSTIIWTYYLKIFMIFWSISYYLKWYISFINIQIYQIQGKRYLFSMLCVCTFMCFIHV